MTVGALAVGGFLLSACGSTASSAPAGLQGKSGKALISAAKAAVLAKGSVTLQQIEKINGETETATIYSSLSGASGTTSGGFGAGTLIQTSTNMYFKENASLLASQFTSGSNLSKWAGKWIDVPSTNAEYASLATGDLLQSGLSQNLPVGPFTTLGIETYKGHKVFAVRGQLSAAFTGGAKATSKSTMYLSLTKPYLPVAIVFTVKSSGINGSGSLVFTGYGQVKALTPPTGSTLITKTSLG
jgi:hypothetical protein